MMGRLKSKKDFHLIFREGKRVTGEIITIYYRKRDEDKTNRLGISISSKVGKAVFRNKIKRWIRESLGSIEKSYNKIFYGYDIVVSVKNVEIKHDFYYIKESLIKSLKNAKIIIEDEPN